MSDERAMVYEDDGTIVYRASSFGGCDTALVAARLNYPASPPPGKLQQVFDAGNAAEGWVNEKLIRQQEEFRMDIGPGVQIRGHIDGMDPHPAAHRVIEIKSQSALMFDSWSEDSWTTDPLWVKYAWQVSIYSHAFGAAVDVWRLDRGTRAISKHSVSPFHTMDEIVARVRHLEGLAREMILPECTAKSWGCPYYQLHEQDEAVADEELDEACSYYKFTQDKEKVAKRQVAEAKQRVIEVLRGRPKVSTFGGYSVKLSTFKKDEYTVKASEQTRLTITEAK